MPRTQTPRPNRPPIVLEDNATRGTGILAVLVWALTLAASVPLLAGAEAAVVAVAGLGSLAVLTTASWWAYRRQDRRLAGHAVRQKLR